MEACVYGYKTIFESSTKMERAIEKACEIAGVKDEGDLSDGNHTFNDLYWQRCVLFAVLVNLFPKLAWKSKKHEDGEPCHDGKNFLVCIETPKGPYSYHYPLKNWDLFKCVELERAKKFDGHTDKDVERLLSLVPENMPRSVLSDLWNKRGDHNMRNYQKPAPLVEGTYNQYKCFPRNQVRAIYSGHSLQLSDGTVVDGFPIGIRGSVEVIVDGCEKGNFEYTPFRWPSDPEEPTPSYYQYRITSHIPEDSPNRPANHVHLTNSPESGQAAQMGFLFQGMSHHGIGQVQGRTQGFQRRGCSVDHSVAQDRQNPLVTQEQKSRRETPAANGIPQAQRLVPVEACTQFEDAFATNHGNTVV